MDATAFDQCRWKKTTVEDCLTISIDALVRARMLISGQRTAGSWQWRNPYSKGHRAALDLVADLSEESAPHVFLIYSLAATGEEVMHEIIVGASRPYFGGRRWWFVCPLGDTGKPCGRRVGRLFLPPGAKYFGCRHCYNLQYRSCQERRGRFERYRRSKLELDRLPYDVALMRVFRTLDKIHRNGYGSTSVTALSGT